MVRAVPKFQKTLRLGPNILCSLTSQLILGFLPTKNPRINVPQIPEKNPKTKPYFSRVPAQNKTQKPSAKTNQIPTLLIFRALARKKIKNENPDLAHFSSACAQSE
jgi:hypothetical protein